MLRRLQGGTDSSEFYWRSVLYGRQTIALGQWRGRALQCGENAAAGVMRPRIILGPALCAPASGATTAAIRLAGTAGTSCMSAWNRTEDSL
jgi:hypothetical protein